MFDRLQLRLLDEWLVALHVDDDIGIGIQLRSGLLDAVGTTLMVVAGHHSLAAKGFYCRIDALIVGSYIGFAKNVDHLFIDSLDDGFSAQHGQGLAGKTCRGIACRNDSNKFHITPFVCFAGAKLAK